jgi:hypothetical protein
MTQKNTWKTMALQCLDKAITDGTISSFGFNKSALFYAYWNDYYDNNPVGKQFKAEEKSLFPYSAGNIFYELPCGKVEGWLGGYKEFVMKFEEIMNEVKSSVAGKNKLLLTQ